MNNQPALASSTSPQPAASSLPAEALAKAGPVETPAESQNRRRLVWLLGGLVILTLGITIGIFSTKFLNQSQNQPQLVSTPSPAPQVQSPSPAPDPTADWKTYTNEKYLYSIKYPITYSMENVNPQNTGGSVEIKQWVENYTTKPTSFFIYTFPKTVTPNISTSDFIKDWVFSNPATEDITFLNKKTRKNTYTSGATTIILVGPVYGESYSYFIVHFAIQKYKGELEEFNQILSTFKFTDIENAVTSVKKIIYQKTPGWTDYKSNTGYSLQIPPGFSDADGSGEEFRDNACLMFFGNNAGGILSARVVPYDGGSRRQLYGIAPGYDYRFEEVLIQDRYKSLIIEAGPISDSGSGSGIVIPVGNNALIISWSNRSKDSSEFNALMSSIKIYGDFNRDNCGK